MSAISFIVFNDYTFPTLRSPNCFYDFNGHKRNDFSHLCIVNYRVYKVGPPLSNFFVAELFRVETEIKETTRIKI